MANIDYKINYRNKKDYLFLPENHSAKKHIRIENIWFLYFVLSLIIFLVLLKIIFNISIVIFISAIIAIFYFLFMLFKVVIVIKARNRPMVKISRKDLLKIKKKDLPIYTIIIPLYREENVIKQIKKAMMSIDYPKEKLDIIITLEEYDNYTREAIEENKMPKYFRRLILPNVNPKTKPKALNVAIREAKGEFIVIYDAEIVPDKNQLKKAYLAFKNHPEISVFQTRLDHYNVKQNILTNLFNAEFSFYYDLFLPGLQKFNLPIPLSGHSTHFRKEAIISVGAWDPYNVAEDCEIGIRLQRHGYKVDILDSFSKEEATSTLSGWIKQRTRWMKGFIQTSIVHMRYPIKFKNQIGGWINFIGFFFAVPGTVIINILNLLYWVLLIIWLITKAPIISSSFPKPILYISFITFLAGNLMFTYLNLAGVYRRNKFAVVKYCILSPIYWILLSFATSRALIQFIFSPHSWEKTVHGTHLKNKNDRKENQNLALSK